MADPELVKYIQNNLTKGFTRVQLTDFLVSKGYPLNDIDAVFSVIATPSDGSARRFNLPIIALVFSVLFFMPFFSLIGLILGIISLRNISRNPSLSGKGIAIAAVVIGGLTITLIILFIGLIGASFFHGLSSAFSEQSSGTLVEQGPEFSLRNVSTCQQSDAEFQYHCYTANAKAQGNSSICLLIGDETRRDSCLKQFGN